MAEFWQNVSQTHNTLYIDTLLFVAINPVVMGPAWDNQWGQVVWIDIPTFVQCSF